MHAGTPVHLPARGVNFLDLIAKHLIGSAMLAYGPLSPCVIATQRHPKRLTQDTNRIVLALLFHDLLPPSWPREKILTVFF